MVFRHLQLAKHRSNDGAGHIARMNRHDGGKPASRMHEGEMAPALLAFHITGALQRRNELFYFEGW